MELRVKQQDKGNGLPQSIAGYDPHLLQAMFIQCVPQQLGKKKKKNRRAKNREGTKNVFQIVRSLSWERQHLLQHCLNTLQKNHIMFQFLLLQLGQKLLHQTKRNKQIAKHRLPSKEDISSSAMPNPKEHDKRQSEKHLVLVFSHTKLQMKLEAEKA